MDLFANLRSLLHNPKPKEIIVPGNIPATLGNCGGSVGAAEQFPPVIDFFARELMRLYPEQLGEGQVDCIVAAATPDALVLASHLAWLCGARFAALQVTEGTPRFTRHHFVPKERVVLVLDECRQFIRLNEAMTALAPHKVQVKGVACVVNTTGRGEYSFLEKMPILALHHAAH